MSSINLTTWKDLIDHLIDWLGANPSVEAQRDAKRASLSGLRDLATAHRWAYYYARGRMNTSAPYSTGTVAYDHTGGTHERQVTLTGGTWPSWAALGSLVLNNVSYEVDTRVSGSVITLTAASNPGADVTAGATFSVYRDTYPLPIDCVAIDQLDLVNHIWLLSYEHPSQWLERQQIYRGQATPRLYTIRGDPNYFGALAVSFFPAPDAAYQADYIYQRRPRQLLIDVSQDGKASLTSGSATVTGTGTSWDSRLTGSVMRFSKDGVSVPTNFAGSNAYRFERVIVSVESATSLTLDAVVDADLALVKYVISDPVDIEEGAMLTCLLRGCEFQLAEARNQKGREAARVAYQQALILGREADSRNMSEMRSGGRRAFPYRLAHMPAGPDVS